MKRNFKDYSLSFLYGLSYALMIITFAIFFILISRWFFYMHIGPLDLMDRSGRSYLEIKEAYDDILDSLLFFYPFKEGNFPYSESGMSHFLDCIPLFLLNNITLIVSFAVFISLFILNKKKVFNNVKIFSLFTFTSLIPLFLTFLLIIVAIIASIDFNFAFTIFHHIFFPGKENWFFDYLTDPIILIFNIQFFIDCAILIFSIILIFYSLPIIKDIKERIKNKKSVS